MKNLYLLKTLCCFSILMSYALITFSQLTNHTYSVLDGQTYVSISQGTVINDTSQLSPGQTKSADDGSLAIALPFAFNFNGIDYFTVTFCTNGWIAMGDQTTVTAIESRTANNLFSTSKPSNVIAGWFRDGSANFPAPNGTGSMVHGLIDTSVYAFEWRNAAASGYSLTSTNTINYMIKLYGPGSSNPGRIELLYGTRAGSLSGGASIGLKDSIGGIGRYINALNGLSTSSVTSTAWPGAGHMFRFDQLQPCSGTPAAGITSSSATSVCPGSSFTLSVNNATTATGLMYQWQSSNNTLNWTDLANATAITHTVSSGINSAVYYRRKTSCGNAASYSTPIIVDVNSTASCAPLNDNPCNATVLAISANDSCTNAVIGTTNFATTSTGFGYNNPVECGVANSPKDVWYRVTTVATGPGSTSLHFRLTKPAGSAMTTANMTLFKANDSCPAMTFSLISGACRNSGTTFSSIEMTVNNLTPNTTYYLRVNPVNNNDNTGLFQLCAYKPIGTPPCSHNISPLPNATNIAVNQYITFQWAASPGAVLYDTYLGTTNPPTPLVKSGTLHKTVRSFNVQPEVLLVHSSKKLNRCNKGVHY
jgi:hypothetical protein